MSRIKFVIVEVIKNILKLFFIFPIRKNRVLFSAYSGKQYSCNPKYICEYLLDKYGNKVEIIWAFINPDDFKGLDKRIKKIRFKSLNFIYHVLTSKVVIDNVESWSILPKRKGQLVINTWHGGGAYKGVGLKRNDSNVFLDRNMLNKNKRIDLYISSCKAFSNLTLKESFNYQGAILECGMPRNDLFFKKDTSFIKEKVRNQFNLKDEKIVLYAPTFRNDLTYRSSMDIKKLLRNLELYYGGKWKLFYRGHYYINSSSCDIEENVIDVSSYPDMQELLLTADILITDYSSSIWDFSFSNKPCFLYADDLKKYDNERQFYTPISSWPFPLATNNNELEMNIRNFDKKVYYEKIKQHHKDLGSFENGNASIIAGEKIITYIKEKNN